MLYYIKLLTRQGLHFSGTPRYIAKSVHFDDFDKITIGDRVVISSDVRFLTHDDSYTTALISQGEIPSTDIAITRPIKVGNNCFIGAKTFILPGAEIGDNCIIGAGCVARGIIPARSVCIGNPGKIICSIDEIAKKWKNMSHTNLRKD